MSDFRIKFCIEPLSPIHRLQLKNKSFDDHLSFMLEEINAYEDLKTSFPELQQEINDLIQLKKNKTLKLQAKQRAIDSLLKYISNKRSYGS